MTEDEIAERRRLLDLGQLLMVWKGQALDVYAALPVDGLARSTIDCVLVDSIDNAIGDLVGASAWAPVRQPEDGDDTEDR